MVAQRRNEIGVRIAMGADRPGVIRLVLREGIVLFGFVLTAGIVLALRAGRARRAADLDPMAALRNE